MKQFLGWDCANRTLAWSYVTIDTHIYSKISILSDELCDHIDNYMGNGFARQDKSSMDALTKIQWSDTLQDPDFLSMFIFILDCLDYFIDNFINFISYGVNDILNGVKINKTNEIERTASLWAFLKKKPVLSNINGVVIIEHQPPKIGSKTNNKSTAVSYQLAFYYIENNPVMIDPKLKNNIALRDDLKLECFYERELIKQTAVKDARYISRKKQSCANFLYLLSAFGLSYVCDDIPRRVLDDLADSLMQILAFLVKNKLFI